MTIYTVFFNYEMDRPHPCVEYSFDLHDRVFNGDKSGPEFLFDIIRGTLKMLRDKEFEFDEDFNSLEFVNTDTLMSIGIKRHISGEGWAVFKRQIEGELIDL